MDPKPQMNARGMPATPELLAMPVLDGRVPFAQGVVTRGIALGQSSSATVDVRLVSEAATATSWFVRALDVASTKFKKPAALDLALDRTRGQNGDVLHLTVTRLLAPEPNATVHGVAFKLEASPSSDFATTHAEYGFVADP